MIAWTFCPSGVSFLMFARKMSPVEIAGMPRRSAIRAAWVPFAGSGRAEDEQSHQRRNPS